MGKNHSLPEKVCTKGRKLSFIFKCNLKDYGDGDDSGFWDKNCVYAWGREKISGEMKFDEKIAS